MRTFFIIVLAIILTPVVILLLPVILPAVFFGAIAGVLVALLNFAFGGGRPPE